MTTDRGELFAIHPDGALTKVPCTYDGIKQGLDGATFDFVIFSPDLGGYIDDEGIFKHHQLNIPVSVVFARPLYGPVVVCRGEPDENGDTVPIQDERYVIMLIDLANRWATVRLTAEHIGQDVDVYPTPDTLPPPQIIAFDTEEQFQAYLERGEIPDGL